VGAGTLYRHFPTRDALIEAVYRTEVEKLAAAERKFSESLPPIEASAVNDVRSSRALAGGASLCQQRRKRQAESLTI
jgi:AcrR family transcriptional regulator